MKKSAQLIAVKNTGKAKRTFAAASKAASRPLVSKAASHPLAGAKGLDFRGIRKIVEEVGGFDDFLPPPRHRKRL